MDIVILLQEYLPKSAAKLIGVRYSATMNHQSSIQECRHVHAAIYTQFSEYMVLAYAFFNKRYMQNEVTKA